MYGKPFHLGYNDDGTPTAFRRRLEEDPLGKHVARLSSEPRPKKDPAPDPAQKMEDKLPPGYRKPATWAQVAAAPKGSVLLACPGTWEPVEHDLESKVGHDGRVRIEGHVGRVVWRGDRVLEGVQLASLRIPEEGRRSGRHG